jgi:hypothetical protein
MSATNVTILNELLSRRPEVLRENLAGYIVEHLDEIEDEMQWAADPTYLSPELREELERREARAIANPDEGVSWEELQERLIGSR